jgi:glycosyltransferase involved in cell wall biosynthesis
VPISAIKNAPIRVCLLTPAFPPEIGGQEAHALELAESLLAQGAMVQVLTRRALAECPRRESLRGVPVARLAPGGQLKGRGWRSIGPMLIFLLNTLNFLLRRARTYDIVLVSGFNVLPVITVFACAITGKRCVVRPESPLEMFEVIGRESLARMGLSQQSVLYRWVERCRRVIARRVDCYIAISAEISRALVQAGIDPRRIVSIPNGINTGRFVPVDEQHRRDLRARLRLPVNARILTYTGRLAVSKGVMMLAEIWRALAPMYPDARLVLVGTGAGSVDGCEAELAQFIDSESLLNCVTRPGDVANVDEWLQASDIFVFPSDAEGFGLSILEAMATGLPMVTTRVGIATEFDDSVPLAMVVPPRDPARFAAALRRLLDDAELCRSLGQRAKRAVKAEYAMESVARRYLDLFAELT